MCVLHSNFNTLHCPSILNTRLPTTTSWSRLTIPRPLPHILQAPYYRLILAWIMTHRLVWFLSNIRLLQFPFFHWSPLQFVLYLQILFVFLSRFWCILLMVLAWKENKKKIHFCFFKNEGKWCCRYYPFLVQEHIYLHTDLFAFRIWWNMTWGSNTVWPTFNKTEWQKILKDFPYCQWRSTSVHWRNIWIVWFSLESEFNRRFENERHFRKIRILFAQ